MLAIGNLKRNRVRNLHSNVKKRIYKLDNFRAILIILVVLGHACQFLIFKFNDIGFLLIYTFHMPAFAFLTGICSKTGEPGKIVRRFLLPYFAFQILFYFFLRFWIDPETQFSVLTPIRHLWYLLSAAIWKSLLTLFDTKLRKKQILYVCISFLAALAIGYLDEFWTILSISRTVVFFPFFLAGFYLKEYLTQPHGFCTKDATKLFALLILTVAVIVLILLQDKIKKDWLYGFAPYSTSDYGPGWRGLILLLATVMTGSLFILMPEKKVPLLSTLGTRTMPVFLFHMFVMLVLNKYRTVLPQQLWLPLLVTVGCVVIFAQKPFVWLASPLTELQKLRQKREKGKTTSKKAAK